MTGSNFEVLYIVLLLIALPLIIIARRCRHTYSAWRWSQDGWIRVCHRCYHVEYGGDDFEAGAPK